jgi:hypothetical protein
MADILATLLVAGLAFLAGRGLAPRRPAAPRPVYCAESHCLSRPDPRCEARQCRHHCNIYCRRQCLDTWESRKAAAEVERLERLAAKEGFGS